MLLALIFSCGRGFAKPLLLLLLYIYEWHNFILPNKFEEGGLSMGCLQPRIRKKVEDEPHLLD